MDIDNQYSGYDYSDLNEDVLMYDRLCRLNHLLCSDGDCRTCNFITDRSLMLVLDAIHNDLEHIKSFIDPNYVPDTSGCNCAACNPDQQ